MYRKHLGRKYATYGVDHDRVRLLETATATAWPTSATVFADGFNKPEDGIGAGLLVRDGVVYFTCIPDLWLLRDTNGRWGGGGATVAPAGYGIHVGFLGHDLHGLRFGPTAGLFQRRRPALNVTTPDGPVVNLESGSVLRCEPDGSGLEIFATGLRTRRSWPSTSTATCSPPTTTPTAATRPAGSTSSRAPTAAGGSATSSSRPRSAEGRGTPRSSGTRAGRAGRLPPAADHQHRRRPLGPDV
jgi:hypothetical protein